MHITELRRLWEAGDPAPTLETIIGSPKQLGQCVNDIIEALGDIDSLRPETKEDLGFLRILLHNGALANFEHAGCWFENDDNNETWLQDLFNHGLDINSFDESGPLISRLGGSDASIPWLLEHGAHPNGITGEGRHDLQSPTVLEICAGQGRASNLELLILNGAEITDQCLTNSILEKDDTDCLRILLAHGADPNIPSRENDWTPLHWAVIIDYGEHVRVLLENGADPDIKDHEGLTPIDLANYNSYTDIVKIFTKSNIKRAF